MSYLSTPRLVTLALLIGSVAFSQSAQQSDSLDVLRLEQEIGQMLMVGVRGIDLDSEIMDQTREQIKSGEIGGIIFFKHNIKNSDQFQVLVRDILELPTNLPLLLAADEEGGKVRRLRKSQGFEEFPSAKDVGAELDRHAAFDLYTRMANQLRKAGLNLNLGPVVDLNTNPKSPAIGKLSRSFSKNPGTVYEFSDAFIQAHRQVGVLTTLKHYPGHGSSREDTHNSLTDITNTWDSSEQVPFKRLIDSAVVDLIMVGHLFDRNLDSQYPASLSRAHIEITLRESLGYTGVVITDDLQMGAIIKRYDLEEIIISAVNSGCDILQFSDPLDLDPDLPGKARAIIITAIEEGRLDPDRIHESFERISNLKQQLNTSFSKTID